MREQLKKKGRKHLCLTDLRGILCTCMLLFWATGSSAQLLSGLKLWYDHPGKDWMESVPLGNGRLGAMPDGGVTSENIVLNDITLWSGGPQHADKPDAWKYLPEIRRLIFEGKNAEAQKLVLKEFNVSAKGAGSSGHRADDPYGCYQILGNLHLKYDYGIDPSLVKPQHYYRDLSLDSAIARCSYEINNVNYYREYLTSFTDDVVMIRLSASRRGKLNFTLSLNRPERYKTAVYGNELGMYGQLNNGVDGKGMKYLARVKIKHEGGQLIPGDSTLQIKHANSAVIYISAGTDFSNAAYKRETLFLLNKAMTKSFQGELSSHVMAYQKLFDRATLTLNNKNLKQAALPTSKRLEAFANDPSDNGLPVLYFQFGRYLLICSTRPGLLPPNLQGLWANSVQTPWNGDYHLDINVEMNHWPLEVTNLPMLNKPFYTLINGLVNPGKKTAKAYYNSPGWVAFTVTNLWGYTLPGGGPYSGNAVSGSGWLCQLLWNHYAFTRDEGYLKKIYPIIKGAAEFYLYTMVKDPHHGWLVTVPSMSPENRFHLPNGKVASVCAGPTIDNQIIRELFTHVIEASDILDQDVVFRKKLGAAKEQLPPNQIDSTGRLMEWLKPYRSTDPHHRHVSPLWGLYPGNEITLAGTPKLAEATKALLIHRGDISTGWSLAWKINLWARLHDGDHAFRLLKDLLHPTTKKGYNYSNGGGTYPNLLCAHPPFQIDGNFGGMAGIAEMLVQSQYGYIEFLPALPDQWPSGHFSGFCVRGGGVAGATWDHHEIKSASLIARVSNKFRIKVPDDIHSVEIRYKKKTKMFKAPGEFVTVDLNRGEKVKILFF